MAVLHDAHHGHIDNLFPCALANAMLGMSENTSGELLRPLRQTSCSLIPVKKLWPYLLRSLKTVFLSPSSCEILMLTSLSCSARNSQAPQPLRNAHSQSWRVQTNEHWAVRIQILLFDRLELCERDVEEQIVGYPRAFHDGESFVYFSVLSGVKF